MEIGSKIGCIKKVKGESKEEEIVEEEEGSMG